MRGCGRDFAGETRRTGHPGAIIIEEFHVRRRRHHGRAFHHPERHRDGHGSRRVVPHKTGELGSLGALPHALDVFGRRVHLSREARRVFVVRSSNKLDGRARVERRPKLGCELVKILVRDGDPHVVLSPLVEKLRRLLVKIFLRLVDVEVKRGAVFGGERRAGLGRLGESRDEKPPEHGRAFGFQEVFCRVDDDNPSGVHRAEHINLVLLAPEHFFEDGLRENAQEARDDLLARFAVSGGEKLRFKKAARNGVESFDVFFELSPVFDKIVKGKNGGLRYGEHRPRQIGKDHALLLGEFRAQEGRENIAVEFQDAVKNLLAFGGFKILEAFQVVVKEVERDGVGKVVRVNQNESVGKLSAVGVETVKAGEFANQVALTVNEGKPEPSFFSFGACQVFQNEELETLRFAVPASREKMQMLEAGRSRDRKGECRGIEIEKGRVVGDCRDEILRSRIVLGNLLNGFRAVSLARGFKVLGELVAEFPKERGRAHVVPIEPPDSAAHRLGGIFHVGEERHAKRGAVGLAAGRRGKGGGGFIEDIA